MTTAIPPTDDEGYLLDPTDWNEDVALAIAELIDINMSEAHWEIVHFVRDYYERMQTVPENRTLLKMLRERHGKELATRGYVQQLFPTASASRPARSPVCASH